MIILTVVMRADNRIKEFSKTHYVCLTFSTFSFLKDYNKFARKRRL